LTEVFEDLPEITFILAVDFKYLPEIAYAGLLGLRIPSSINNFDLCERLRLFKRKGLMF